MKNKRTVLSLLLICTSLLAACGDESDGSVDSTTIEIAGMWETSFGTPDDNSVVITNSSWSDPFLDVEVVEFDNETNTAITQNPSDPPEMVMPDVYNRLVWTEPADDQFWYCIVGFNIATLEEARSSTATADQNDFDTGCGGFSWSVLAAPQP